MTKITVKLLGLPECVGGGICHFPDVDRACQAVMVTIQMCLPIARIELLDATQNRHSCLGGIIADFDGQDFAWDADEGKHKQLWTARHNAYHASHALRRLPAGYLPMRACRFHALLSV